MSVLDSKQQVPSSMPKRRNRPAEFTERDGAALAWLGEMYGARHDVLSVLLGRLGQNGAPLSRRATRDQVERWRRADLVRVERALGYSWVTPTRKGLDRVGLDFGTWAVPVTRVRHTHAVNVLRLWWEEQEPSATCPWVCERETFKQRGRDRWHIPDGVIADPRATPGAPPTYLAFEVELTHKTRKALADEVLLNLRAGVEGVLYYVESDEFAERLRADIAAVQERTSTRKRVSVNLLPQVHGVEYLTEKR